MSILTQPAQLAQHNKHMDSSCPLKHISDQCVAIRCCLVCISSVFNMKQHSLPLYSQPGLPFLSDILLCNRSYNRIFVSEQTIMLCYCYLYMYVCVCVCMYLYDHVCVACAYGMFWHALFMFVHIIARLIVLCVCMCLYDLCTIIYNYILCVCPIFKRVSCN